MADWRTGDLVLERYRLESILGSGATADVWLATDERLGREVALKVLHPHLLPDSVSRERFVVEARAVARLRHPRIVGIHDVVADGSIVAIVFEYVPGESLETRLGRPPQPSPEEAARIVADVADALGAAHAAGIVHRDVKPANVLLAASDAAARLVDFGIARAVEPARARLTRTGEVVGTLATMAPEQLAGEDSGPATDLYALGAVLYRLLAGRQPFDATTPTALAEQQRRPPPSIPSAPAPLDALARRLLSPDPARRPASAAEVAAFLRGWLEGSDATPAAGPTRDRRPAPHPAGPSDPTLLALPLTGPPRARRRFVAIPLALAGVGAVAVLALAAQSLLPPAASAPGTPSAVTSSGPPAVVPLTPSASPTPTASATPSPTPPASPTPTPTPTPTPLPTALAILSPLDNAIVSSARLDVVGEAPPGAVVTQDIPLAPDAHATADAAGHWSILAILHPGDNTLTFRLGDDRSTDQIVHVNYQP